MLTVTRISPGDGYRYVMEQVAAGRHDLRPTGHKGPTPYYINHTARGESPGWWAGNGAAVLGVRGWVFEKQMRNLIGQGRHPTTGFQLGQKWRIYAPMTDEYRDEAVRRALTHLPDDATVEQRDKVWHDIMNAPERRAVSAYDVTVSPVNSVSLLWAFGDDSVKRDVMAAHHAGVRALLDHLQRHGAFTRTGAGGVRQLDTQGLAALVFDHRMSRERDPQLHSHIVVSAKVKTVDGNGNPQWLALDGRAFYRATVGAGSPTNARWSSNYASAVVSRSRAHRLRDPRDRRHQRGVVAPLQKAARRHHRGDGPPCRPHRTTRAFVGGAMASTCPGRDPADPPPGQGRGVHRSGRAAVAGRGPRGRARHPRSGRRFSPAGSRRTANAARRILRLARRLHRAGVDEEALRTAADQLRITGRPRSGR